MLQNRIRLEFLGAAGGVTGSSTLLSYTRANGDSTHLLIDCGLFQGDKNDRIKNREALSYDPSSVDAVIVTHAHLDHSGLLPRLGRRYPGHVYVTQGTADLLKIMLLDSAKLQEEDAEFANRTGYSNHRPAEPLYTVEDSKKILSQLTPMPYHKWFTVSPCIKFRFVRAGHIIGSSSIELKFEDGGERFTLGFSGDVGHHRSTTLEGPESLFDCDALVLESTYGDRLQSGSNPNSELAARINEVIDSNGTLIIPSFAVGRAQEVIYRIRQLEDQRLIKPIPVVLDSPMSEEATAIYLDHAEDFKKDVQTRISKSTFFPKRFEIVKSPQQSSETCVRKGPLVVISASGMLQGGRILHHLKSRLPSPKNTVLFVGYQAEGTKGKFLLGRPTELRIHHEPIPVRAKIETIPTLSGHADQSELIEWIRSAKTLPKKIILNHGNPSAMSALQQRLKLDLGIETLTMTRPQEISLA